MIEEKVDFDHKANACKAFDFLASQMSMSQKVSTKAIGSGESEETDDIESSPAKPKKKAVEKAKQPKRIDLAPRRLHYYSIATPSPSSLARAARPQ